MSSDAFHTGNTGTFQIGIDVYVRFVVNLWSTKSNYVIARLPGRDLKTIVPLECLSPIAEVWHITIIHSRIKLHKDFTMIIKSKTNVFMV